MRILITALLAIGLLVPQALLPAAAATPGTLTLTAPASARMGTDMGLTGQYAADTEALAGHTVYLERATGTTWARLASALTDAEGRVSYTVRFEGEARYRLVFEGTAELDPVTSAPRTVRAAVEAKPTKLALTATPAEPLMDRAVKLTARLTSEGAGQPDVLVTFYRNSSEGPVEWGSARTDGQGRAVVERPVGRVPVRVFAKTEASSSLQAARSEALTLRPRPHEVRLAWRVPATVVDEREVKFVLQVLTRDGRPVRNVPVKLRRSGTSAVLATARTNAKGLATFTQRPRKTYAWWAQAGATGFTKAATSVRKTVRNVPPGKPVALPGPAPRIKLPAQPKAVLPGAAVRITPIPDSVWQSMQGKSWRPGCISRSSLRYVRTNYWAYDGYRRQGELIITASAAGDFRRALESFHAHRVPIRAMYRVDRFGYSARLNGADDYASMAAGNTSAFNCRNVVGRPGVLSPHASGRSFDINPWENPYASSHGWVPNSYWVGRSHPRVAWRSGSHQVVRLLRAAGFSWTYGVRDAHHFDA